MSARRQSRGQDTADTRTPKRVATETAIEEAALRVLERDGVLSGLNMQDVADEAGVARGLINHYFGNRRALLRAALDRGVRNGAPQYEAVRTWEPAEKGTRQFREYTKNPVFAELLALLAVDGDEQAEPIVFVEERLADYEREKHEGAYVADFDIEAAIAVWDSTLLGYSLFREHMAAQLKLAPRELDRRVLGTLARMWSALQEPAVDGEAPDRRARSRR